MHERWIGSAAFVSGSSGFLGLIWVIFAAYCGWPSALRRSSTIVSVGLGEYKVRSHYS